MRLTADQDGDGFGDLLVSSQSDVNGAGCGRVWILSATTGAEFAHLDGPQGGLGLGVRVADAGDADGDGVRDLLLGTVADQAWLVSGATLLPLYTFEDRRGKATGSALAGVSDVDGDRRAEVVLGDSEALSGAGLVTLHAGNDLYLDLSPIEVAAGQALLRTVRTGIPGNLGLIAIEEIDGTSVFIVIGGVRTFDASGSIVDSATIPAGLSGHRLGYRAFAINARGRISRSEREYLDFL